MKQSLVKSLPAMLETWVLFLGWEYPLEKEMAAYSSILALKIPWMEEAGRRQPMGSQSQTELSNFTFMTFFWEEPKDGGWLLVETTNYLINSVYVIKLP